MLRVPGGEFSLLREAFKQKRNKKVRAEFFRLSTFHYQGTELVKGYAAGCAPAQPHVGCTCVLRIEGTHEQLLDYDAKLPMRDFSNAVRSWISEVTTRFEFHAGEVVEVLTPNLKDLMIIRTMLRFKGDQVDPTNIRIEPPPLAKTAWPRGEEHSVDWYPIKTAVLRADMTHYRLKYGTDFRQHIYPLVGPDGNLDKENGQKRFLYELPDPKKVGLIPQLLCKTNVSMYWTAFGTTAGHPHWVNRASGMYPTKALDAVSKNIRDTHKMEYEWLTDIKTHTTDILEMMYHQYGTRKFWGKLRLPLDSVSTAGRALHASAGENPGPESVTSYDGVKLKIGPNSSKYVSHISDIRGVLQFVRDPRNSPAVYWKSLDKTETGFNLDKDKRTVEEWDADANKCRTFVVPSSVYALGEIIVGQRMEMERGRVNKIGFSWAHGGADRLAASLNIRSIKQALMKILVEGDAKTFDQTVKARLTDLYMSMGLIYDARDSPYLAARKEITRWLTENMICRITHFMGPIWGQQRGGVPSGSQNTSTMDGWCSFFYFASFVRYQAEKATGELREKLMTYWLQMLILCVIYGDDFLYTYSEDPDLHTVLSGRNYQEFCKKYYDVDIRDLKDGVTFISVVKDGVLLHVGACFLKHYFVINPYKDMEGQPLFLPFRETKEYVVRAVIGRDASRHRSLFDVLLSTIGHAYGTYASNRDAYDKLKCLYLAALDELGMDTEAALREAVDKATPSHIKRLNRAGIELGDILTGFPSWNKLIQQNVIDITKVGTSGIDYKWYTTEEES